MSRNRRAGGFTLIELLVALFAMALLAIMSWRGLDGMARARAQTEARSDEVLTLQVGLAQWAADLEAILPVPQVKALEWNGRVLRMTRRGSASPGQGLLVVAWTRRIVNGTGMWLRWQSPPLTSRGQVEEAWLRADLWSQNPGDAEKRYEVAVVPLQEWQLFYFRENAWTNPQSSDATNLASIAGRLAAAAGTSVTPATLLPDGIRLVLTLPEGQAISGTITRDWVRPTAGGSQQ